MAGAAPRRLDTVGQASAIAHASLALPIFAFLVTLLAIITYLGARSTTALLLLPPLVLLAVPGV